MEPITEERHKLSVDLGTRVVEDRLVKEARAGSHGAFEELFRNHYNEAMRVARSFANAPGDADDIVQAAFIKAWQAIDQFRPGAPFGPWIRAIVANEARSHIRSRARRANAGERLGQEFIRTTVQEPSPEEIQLKVEAGDELNRAIGSLSPVDQQVIRLRYELDLSEAEMAECLDVAPGTVKSRLSRALSRLRQHIVIVILALIVVSVAAVPPVRAAVERLLGIAGGEKVVPVPELPDRLDPRPFAWGPPVEPGAAGNLNRFGDDPPEFNGIEPEVRLRSDLNRPILTFVYGADTVSVMDGKGPLVLAKLVPPGTDVKSVETAEGEGIWLSGASHALATLDSKGMLDRGPKTRVESNVLALRGNDGRDYRVQTDGDLQHALDLVSSLVPGEPGAIVTPSG